MNFLAAKDYAFNASVTKRTDDTQRTYTDVTVEALDQPNNLVLVDEDGATKAIAVEGLRHIWVPDLDFYKNYMDNSDHTKTCHA
jgi:hypothetical protein